jgi:hypothetical protein
MLFVACGKEPPLDPYSAETIQKDIAERPVNVLYEELERVKPYAPPLDGVVTDAQIETFVNVTRLSRRIIELSEAEVDRKIESAQRDEDRYSRMATAFGAIGNTRNAATSVIRASLTLEVNPHEYDWVARQIYSSAGFAVRQRALDREIGAAEKARSAEINEYLRSQREQELAALRQQRRSLLERLGDAERANAAQVLAHAETLAPYVPRLRSK